MTRSKVAVKYVNVQDRMPDESAQTTRVPVGTLITVSTVRDSNRAEIVDFSRRMNKR